MKTYVWARERKKERERNVLKQSSVSITSAFEVPIRLIAGAIFFYCIAKNKNITVVHRNQISKYHNRERERIRNEKSKANTQWQKNK